ncbi:MAG TPA: aldehyde ferredoxin oxidoreductase C-terminal domain-containing protein [Rectinemataceae bacterium]
MRLETGSLRLIASWSYAKVPTLRGYNMRTLLVDLDALGKAGSATETKASDAIAERAAGAAPAPDRALSPFLEKPVSEEMRLLFVGGKGFGLKLLWDATRPETKWDDPENAIVIAMGPICGNTNYPGSGKSLVTCISPLTGIPIDSNVGGFFGPFLKFSGFDALELRGKSASDIIVFIDGDSCEARIYEAPESLPSDSHRISEILTHGFASGDDDRSRANVAVVSTGRAAERSPMGLLNFSFWDRRRGGCRVKQAGRGGIGRVFRDKGLKALVCRFSGLWQDSNSAADPAAVQRIGLRLQREIIQGDDLQCKMRRVGTAHLMEVMNDHDLLPVQNHRFGQDPEGGRLASTVWEKLFSQGLPDGCWYGCSLACAHAVDKYEVKTGPYKGQKVCVDGPEYETAAGVGSNLAIWDPEGVLEINFYCDTYGVDTISFGTTAGFLMECWEYGLLDAEATGGIVLEWGNWRGACELLHSMARGEGFGLLAGRGTKYLSEWMAANRGADPALMKDIALHGKGLEQSQYISKESLAQQGGYYLTNKGPQHDEAWLIFMDMVDNRIPSFEDKAEALHYFPMFRTWFGLQGLCKLPWNDIEPASNADSREPSKVPEHVDNYCALYTAITGEPLDPESLLRQSERVYNFQRLFNLRKGKGRREDDYPPYRAVGPVTPIEYHSRERRYDSQLEEILGARVAVMGVEEKIAALRRHRMESYERLMDAVYARRGWTSQGIPKPEKLEELGIDFPEALALVGANIGMTGA